MGLVIGRVHHEWIMAWIHLSMLTLYGPRQANLVLIAYASSEGSGEPAHPRSRQNLRCLLIQAVSQEESSDRKPDPWPLWMAGHAQLKLVMMKCSKTQIRLTGLIYGNKLVLLCFCCAILIISLLIFYLVSISVDVCFLALLRIKIILNFLYYHFLSNSCRGSVAHSQ